MKIKAILAAAIAATVILASCAKEDKTNNDGTITKPMTLVIKNNSLGGTRGVDNKITDKSVTLETGWVLFLIDGVVDQKLEIGASADVTAAELAGGYTIDEVKNTVDQVVVLANLGSTVHTAVGAAADLSTITWELEDIQAEADLSGIALWGQGACTETASVMTASVTVAPMAARIQIPGIQLSGNFTYELAGVFINNVYTSFDGMGTAGAKINNGTVATDYVTGTYTPSYMADGSGTIKASGNGSYPHDGSEYKSFWAYNVFPAEGGSSKIPHIVFHLKDVKVKTGFTVGEQVFDIDHIVNGDGDVYLTIGGYTGADEFEAGYIYTISTEGGTEDTYATTGIAPSTPGIIIPDNVVVDEDNDEPEKGNTLTGSVTVTVQQWEPATLTPEW